MDSRSAQSPFERAQFDILLDQYSTSPSLIRSLPDLVRYNAIHNPHRLFCIQCKQSATEQGSRLAFVRVTFLQLNEAIDRCCRWLETVEDIHAAKLGSDGSIQKSRPVALFMESDLGLFIHIVALLTVNVPVRFFALPRLPDHNPPPFIVRFAFNQTQRRSCSPSAQSNRCDHDYHLPSDLFWYRGCTVRKARSIGLSGKCESCGIA